MSQQYLTATEYALLYLSAQTAAAGCTLCDELVEGDAERHVQLAVPYGLQLMPSESMSAAASLWYMRQRRYTSRRLPMSSALTDARFQAAPSKRCNCMEAARHLSTAVKGIMMCAVVPGRRVCAQCGAEARTANMD